MTDNPPESPGAAGASAGPEAMPSAPPPTETVINPWAAPAPEAAPGASAAVAAESAGERPRRRRRRRRGRRGGEGEGGGAAAAAPEPEAGSPAPRQKPPHEARHPRRGRRGADRPSEHHATTAVRALSAMAQGLLQVEGIDFLSLPRFMDISVRIPLDPQRDGAKAASQVIERILERVKEVRDNDRALVPGAVYSYFTETAQAEACRPSELRLVFDGYSSTGRPVFTDFVTMAIERKEPGLDELLAGDDVVLTHVRMGRLLRTAQLAEFGKGSPVYRILGQVDAGLFPLVTGNKKAAFSFQLLRGSTLEGRPRLRIHPVGAADVLDLADPSVAQILSAFQRRLDSEALRLSGKLANGEQLDEEEFVRPLLTELARQIAGHARRKSWRTKHADQRADEGRPTSKAYEDAEAARDDELLWDDRQNTVVVLGPRGRVHVFARDGKHVTSLVMQGSAIGKRRQQGQWRQAEPEERGEFRIALRKLRGEGRATVATEEPAAPAIPAPAPAVPAVVPLAEATAAQPVADAAAAPAPPELDAGT